VPGTPDTNISLFLLIIYFFGRMPEKENGPLLARLDSPNALQNANNRRPVLPNALQNANFWP
jgi:hypothetical protein